MRDDGVPVSSGLYCFLSHHSALDFRTGTDDPLLKPLIVCFVLSALYLFLYTAYTCWKLKVKPSVLIPKLMPDFLIALSTASSSAAFSSAMEINEKKLGIDRSLSRMGVPIGSIVLNGSYSVFYVVIAAFMAESCGVQAGISWWITLGIVTLLLSISTPPVAGGMIPILSVMMAQLHIPSEALAIGVTLAMLLDFICTGVRLPILHMELALQAEQMDLLDYDVLRN